MILLIVIGIFAVIYVLVTTGRKPYKQRTHNVHHKQIVNTKQPKPSPSPTPTLSPTPSPATDQLVPPAATSTTATSTTTVTLSQSPATDQLVPPAATSTTTSTTTVTPSQSPATDQLVPPAATSTTTSTDTTSVTASTDTTSATTSTDTTSATSLVVDEPIINSVPPKCYKFNGFSWVDGDDNKLSYMYSYKLADGTTTVVNSCVGWKDSTTKYPVIDGTEAPDIVYSNPVYYKTYCPSGYRLRNGLCVQTAQSILDA